MSDFYKFFLIILFCSLFTELAAQTLPAINPQGEEYFRRMQLAGRVDSTISFTVKPLSFSGIKDLMNSSDTTVRLSGYSKNTKSQFTILSATWIAQYNTHPANNWNDGPMIPVEGFQTMFSAGIYAKIGPLSIQLKPEFVFAGGGYSSGRKFTYGSADLPLKYSKGSYTKATWGQSSIRLNFDPVSIGYSNENLWWGPAVRNPLLMSNTAPGFKHITLNTTKPIVSPIGSFETQIVGGRLESSGVEAVPQNDWRYFSGLIFSYQPKWVPGLFLGFTRSFQIYNQDIDGFNDYFPFFQAFQKVNTKEDTKRRDQITSVFSRWLIPSAMAEVYFEYGINDHSYNTRDFVMSPDHSRAYTVGFLKMLNYKSRPDEFIKIGLELTKMEQSTDWVARNAGEWYTHHQLVEGYTHWGQLLGAGVGPGANYQSLDISCVNKFNRIGIEIERYEHNVDFANTIGYKPWVDFSIAPSINRQFKKFILSTKLQAINSINYQWQDGANGGSKKDKFGFNTQIGIIYGFN